MHEGYEFRSERESGIETAIVHFHAVNYPILTYTLLVDQISFFLLADQNMQDTIACFFPSSAISTTYFWPLFYFVFDYVSMSRLQRL
jgi:hypothetical protein